LSFDNRSSTRRGLGVGTFEIGLVDVCEARDCCGGEEIEEDEGEGEEKEEEEDEEEEEEW